MPRQFFKNTHSSKKHLSLPSLTTHRSLNATASWFFAFLLIIISSLYINWKLLASADFLYPLWYYQNGIDTAIDRFGSENRYRNHFETTSDEERFRLFGEIVDAIHNDGKGLSDLRYHTKSGTPIDTLLRKQEIEHLEDVAKLTSVFLWIGLSATLLLLPTLALLKYKQIPMPKVAKLLGLLLTLVVLITITVLLIGPVNVFYALHTWMFPADHQWFFYYQESLMTTMMLAPKLFGYITVLWVLLSFILIGVCLKLCQRITS